MKLRSKIILGFLFTALAPVLLLSTLLYVYLGRSYQSLNAWQAETAVSSFRFYLDNRFENLEAAAARLQADKDFLIALLGDQDREAELATLLEGAIASREFQFALLQLPESGQIIRAFQPEAAVAQSCDFPRFSGGGQENLAGIATLGDAQTFAAVAVAPIFYRGQAVAQLLVGELLEDVVRGFPLTDFDLAALMITANDRVVIARAEREVTELLPRIATATGEQQLWLLQLGDTEYLVRSSMIAGIDGGNVARLSFLLDLNERSEAQARLLRLYLLLVAAAILLAVLAGFFLSRRLSRPLTEMSTAARQLARGSVPEKIIYFPEDEIGDLVGSVNRLTEDLRSTQARLQQSEQIAAWQMLARQMAHELKNFLMPLTTATGHLQKLLAEGRTERAQLDQIAAGIGAEVQRMRKLLAAFSEFARLPAPEMRMASLETLLSSLKNAYASRLRDGSLHLVVEPSMPTLHCDPDQIRQVLLNLLGNSYEAGATVTEIKVSHREEQILFEVADDGVGIGAEADPFAPLYTTKSGGSGLGLAIVRRIIVDHGGEISHSANPTGGTVFRFSIPVVQS